MDRRTFLQSATVLSGSLLACGINHAAAAATARIDVPVVDRVVVREITDGAHDVFLEASKLAASRCSAPARTERKAGRCMANGAGAASKSQKGGETKRHLLDFGSLRRLRQQPRIFENRPEHRRRADPEPRHYDHVGGSSAPSKRGAPRCAKIRGSYRWRR